MTDVWQKRYEDKVAALEQSEQKFQHVVDKCNELIKEKNLLISELDHAEKRNENLKQKNKEFQAKLLLQVGTLQNEKKTLMKENENLTAENQSLRMKIFDSETFLNSLRDEILDFRDKKNSEIQKLEQQLAEAKNQISSVTSPVSQTGKLPELSLATLEVLQSENDRLRRELKKFKSIQTPLRNPEMMRKRNLGNGENEEDKKADNDFAYSTESYEDIKLRLKRSCSVETIHDHSGKFLNFSRDHDVETKTSVNIISEKLLKTEFLRNELKQQLTDLQSKVREPIESEKEEKPRRKKSSIAQLIDTGGPRVRKRTIVSPPVTLTEIPNGT